MRLLQSLNLPPRSHVRRRTLASHTHSPNPGSRESKESSGSRESRVSRAVQRVRLPMRPSPSKKGTKVEGPGRGLSLKAGLTTRTISLIH